MAQKFEKFRCAVCKDEREGPFLLIATRDGANLHKVCAKHIPKGHDIDREEGVGKHMVKPNADGTVRSMVYEDLKV